jgi:hypothetical protein
MSRDYLVVLAVAQLKVQQELLPHPDMDIQARLNKGIRVVLQGLSYISAVAVARDKQDKMETSLLQGQVEQGHLFPGHLLRMVDPALHLADILVVAVGQALMDQVGTILEVLADRVAAVTEKVLDSLGLQVMLIPAAAVAAQRRVDQDYIRVGQVSF